MIIGICGKSGSGKSTLANKLVNSHLDDYVTIDIDKVGHQVLELPLVKNELKEYFGEEVLNNNEINRKVLSKLVFNSSLKMNKLTEITWPFMEVIIDQFINKNMNKVIILDWQLLPKTKYFSMCDLTILLDIAYEERKKQSIIRDRITEREFLLREQNSLNINSYQFDVVINTIDTNIIDRIQNLIKL